MYFTAASMEPEYPLCKADRGDEIEVMPARRERGGSAPQNGPLEW